jgi:4-amino-4-deoxy-L-arabinose transferase-like glycosyltransferase
MIQKILNNKVLSIVILLAFHFLFRILLLSINAFPFNADEAIVGLMAKHILAGQNFLYFYGQSYMGSLDVYLVAFGFLVFGEEIWVIRLIQIFLYGLVIVFTYLFVDITFRNKKIAFISSLFLVFPAVNIVLYTTVSLGGYGESLLFGIVSFYLAALIVNEIREPGIRKLVYMGILGFIFGIGLYVNPISLTMILPAVVFVMCHLVKQIEAKKRLFVNFLVLVIFFLLGSSPFWYSLFFTNGFSVVTEIGGSAVAIESNSYIQKILSHVFSFLLFGPTVILGLRPPWEINIIGKYFVPIIIFFWILIIYMLIRKKINPIKEFEIFIPLIGIILLVVMGFIFTSFGIDPSGRYFLPFAFPLSMFVGYAIIRLDNKFINILAMLTIVFQIYGSLKSGLHAPYITTQFYSPAQVNHSKITELKNFLLREHEYFGFSNYWISYPLAFISDEKIISIPKLPYHQDLRYTARDNRITKYNDLIKTADTYFYLTSNNALLDDLLIHSFIKNDVSYQQKEIDDYHIFYNLSKKITPEELGIVDEFK